MQADVRPLPLWENELITAVWGAAEAQGAHGEAQRHSASV